MHTPIILSVFFEPACVRAVVVICRQKIFGEWWCSSFSRSPTHSHCRCKVTFTVTIANKSPGFSQAVLVFYLNLFQKRTCWYTWHSFSYFLPSVACHLPQTGIRQITEMSHRRHMTLNTARKDAFSVSVWKCSAIHCCHTGLMTNCSTSHLNASFSQLHK